MSAVETTHRRVLRRALHSPRTSAAVTAASVLAVVLAAGVVLGVWMFIDAGFADTVSAFASAAVERLAGAPTAAIGIVLLVLALVLISLAVLPGRRARRGRIAPHGVVVIDDGVLADAVADRVARRLGIDSSQVSVTVRARTVRALVTPISGVEVAHVAARHEIERTLAELSLEADATVQVAATGRLA